MTGNGNRNYARGDLWSDMVDDQYRGLLTEREREIIKGEADVSDNYRYRVVSRVRSKIENVDEDVRLLAKYREDLLEELREVVCKKNEWNRSISKI